MNQDDYYKMLGVDQNASPKQIKEAYRELAFKHHPDRNKEHPETAETMKRVNEAYAVLSNPEKRREYDSLRQRFGSSAYGQFRQNYSEQDIFSGSDIHQVFEEMSRMFGLRGFEEIFKGLHGQGRQTFEFKGPGFMAKGFVFFGTFGPFNLNKMQLPMTGTLGKLSRYLFKQIGGTYEMPENGADIHDGIHLHPLKAQQGGPYAYFLRKRSKKLVVQIPPNVKQGQQIRLSEMGEDGRRGGKPGNLYLKVHIKTPLLEKMKGFVDHIRK